MSILGTPSDILDGGSYTAEVGTDRLVVFAITTDANDAGVTLDSGTFGGVAMEFTAGANINSNTEISAIAFIREANIPSGSQSVALTYSGGTPDTANIYCMTLDGRDQTTPVDVSNEESFSSNPYAGTLTGAAGGADAIVCLCGQTPSRTITTLTGDFAEEKDENSGTYYSGVLSAQNVTAGDQSFSATFSLTQNGASAMLSFAAASGSYAIDSSPASINAGTAFDVVVSNPAVTPTDLNTEIKFDNDSGPAATINSVTGSDPYTINATFPTSTTKQFDATGYALYVEVAAENATTAAIPYNPATGYSEEILSNSVDPIVARPQWVSGNDYGVAFPSSTAVSAGDIFTNSGNSYYCNEDGTTNTTAPTHTGGATNSTSGVSLTHLEYLSTTIADVYNDGYIYTRTTAKTNSTTTPADGVDGWTQGDPAGSILDGFTGVIPISGDQVVYQTQTSGGVGVTVGETGEIVFASTLYGTQTLDYYIIEADGTVSSEETITLIGQDSANVFEFLARGLSRALTRGLAR